MNNKAEYNRCALPRLTAKLGERDLEKWREEDKLEMEKEASIEEGIRIRKKEKAKRRGEGNRRKKRRTDTGNIEKCVEEEERETLPKTQSPKTSSPETPKKRKYSKEDNKPSKRVRPNYNIKRYISCRKWREED